MENLLLLNFSLEKDPSNLTRFISDMCFRRDLNSVSNYVLYVWPESYSNANSVKDFIAHVLLEKKVQWDSNIEP